MTKIVYQTDPATAEYLAPHTLGAGDLSPLEPGLYLIPGGCVETAPPEPREGCARIWTGAAWAQIEDHRGRTVYLDGAATVIADLGPLPDGAALTPPEPAPVTAAEVKAEAGRRLGSTDWYVIRAAEGGAAVPVPEAVTAYRAAVRAASDALETMDPIPADYTEDAHWPEVVA